MSYFYSLVIILAADILGSLQLIIYSDQLPYHKRRTIRAMISYPHCWYKFISS